MRRNFVFVVLLVAALLAHPLYAEPTAGEAVLAVLDFTASGVPDAEARLLTGLLSAWIGREGTCRLVDPLEREAILEQIESSYARGPDASRELEVGRLLSATQLIVGSIGQIGGWLIVSARRVDVATGQTLNSVSEKYPSLEALLDGARQLALQTLGATGVAPSPPATARALIAASNRGEVEERLRRLGRRIDPQQYTRWLAEQGFAEYERGAPVEERLVFLQEYWAQTNTRGHAAELTLSYLPPYDRRYSMPGGSIAETGQYIGLAVGWSYQFSSGFSSGAYVGLTWRPALVEEFDSFGTKTGEADSVPLGYQFGPLLVLRDKTEGPAVLLAPGFGYSAGALLCPLRCGIYIRNFYVGYTGLWRYEEGVFLHGVESGYSLFFGQRRSWPARGGRE
jgi:hypothetical protein